MEKVTISSEADKKELLKKSEISVWIDNYDDIFSDFDSRPYSERALSDDFLTEMKRASRDKPSGDFELNFLIPGKQRNSAHETLIKKRLKEHFRKHHTRVHEEVGKIRKHGGMFVFFGVIAMIIATLINFYISDKSVLPIFLIVLLEPGGWFLFWEGLRLIIFEPNAKKNEMEFYDKMSMVDIVFHSY